MKIAKCMNCMEEIPENTKECPFCGFIEDENPAPPHQLPYYTVLNGKYMVGRCIGEGGFGITYIGWDLNLGIKVAIKEFYPEGFVGRDGEMSHTVRSYQGDSTVFFNKGKEKFLEEARSMGKFMELSGIVSVKDFFTENNTVYIVMEYLDGISLKAYAKKKDGKIPKEELLAFMKPVIQSLSEVHKSNLIHRDISPDNIMLCKNGQVKLIDFGAAREVSQDNEKSLSIMLKKGYSPEEQYRTRGLQGTWTDVYALSATIYALLTGVKPDEPLDRMEKETLKPLSEYGVVLSKRQEAVLIKGLAIKAEDRVQTVDELYSGLYCDGNAKEFLSKDKKTRNKVRKRIATALVLGMLCVVGLVGYRYYMTVPVKESTTCVYVAQVNETLTQESLQNYQTLWGETSEFAFVMDGVESSEISIMAPPEEEEAYHLEIRCVEDDGRIHLYPMEIQVAVPIITITEESLTCSVGERIEDFSQYVELDNCDYLDFSITDDTDNTVAMEQPVKVEVSSENYSFSNVIMVDYYDVNAEAQRVVQLMAEEGLTTAVWNDEMKEYADFVIDGVMELEANSAESFEWWEGGVPEHILQAIEDNFQGSTCRYYLSYLTGNGDGAISDSILNSIQYYVEGGSWDFSDSEEMAVSVYTWMETPRIRCVVFVIVTNV